MRLRPAGPDLLDGVALAIEAATGSAGVLGLASAYHQAGGGAAWRARIALGCSAVLGIPGDRAIRLAAACELVHQASIVHDDVQDGSRVRRDRSSALDRFGAPTAICLGDHLLAAAFGVLAELPRCGPLVRLFASRVSEAAAGQAEEFSRDLWQDMGLPRYRALAAAKAGAVLALPVQGAMLLAGLPCGAAELAGEAARALGVAYQASDDIEDLAGDLARGALNGVVVFGLGSQGPDERQALLRLLDRARRHGLPVPEAALQARRLRRWVSPFAVWAGAILAETATGHGVGAVLAEAAASIAGRLDPAMATQAA